MFVSIVFIATLAWVVFKLRGMEKTLAHIVGKMTVVRTYGLPKAPVPTARERALEAWSCPKANAEAYEFLKQYQGAASKQLLIYKNKGK